jgi:3-oxoacyl-[acyl-carrier protein] reductase
MPGRVALVTGGSRGIGRAIAERLAADGCRVAVNYHTRSDAAEEVVAAIRKGGGEAIAVGGDVGDGDAVAAAFAAIEAGFGPVEILVNNAGITADDLLLRMKPEAWESVIRTNLDSVYHCTRAALRGMLKARWGRVVSVTSVAGIAGNAGQANYAAAKAGIIGFTKSVAREVGSRGITVNAVAPGFIGRRDRYPGTTCARRYCLDRARCFGTRRRSRRRASRSDDAPVPARCWSSTEASGSQTPCNKSRQMDRATVAR